MEAAELEDEEMPKASESVDATRPTTSLSARKLKRDLQNLPCLAASRKIRYQDCRRDKVENLIE